MKDTRIIKKKKKKCKWKVFDSSVILIIDGINKDRVTKIEKKRRYGEEKVQSNRVFL